ncbi:hypothetical protein M407DRAFT_12850 [Tulasnella calospora MUT 4182]|uniref:Ubiquitin-like protease family profile domain-containing protein n=1 Tax=Tulasnella calospora MUT 4182 TaxID=1051891 RepID=A0A0C3Q236_9AGAM|nr:hypothetical protein M407DRAFT_12850 [Tulasnella calospora MUT 4182]
MGCASLLSCASGYAWTQHCIGGCAQGLHKRMHKWQPSPSAAQVDDTTLSQEDVYCKGMTPEPMNASLSPKLHKWVWMDPALHQGLCTERGVVISPQLSRGCAQALHKGMRKWQPSPSAAQVEHPTLSTCIMGCARKEMSTEPINASLSPKLRKWNICEGHVIDCQTSLAHQTKEQLKCCFTESDPLSHFTLGSSPALYTLPTPSGLHWHSVTCPTTDFTHLPPCQPFLWVLSPFMNTDNLMITKICWIGAGGGHRKEVVLHRVQKLESELAGLQKRKSTDDSAIEVLKSVMGRERVWAAAFYRKSAVLKPDDPSTTAAGNLLSSNQRLWQWEATPQELWQLGNHWIHRFGTERKVLLKATSETRKFPWLGGLLVRSEWRDALMQLLKYPGLNKDALLKECSRCYNPKRRGAKGAGARLAQNVTDSLPGFGKHLHAVSRLNTNSNQEPAAQKPTDVESAKERYVAFPMNASNSHWVLGILTHASDLLVEHNPNGPIRTSLLVLNSIHGYNPREFNARYMDFICLLSFKKPLRRGALSKVKVLKPEVLQQPNTSDCGIYPGHFLSVFLTDPDRYEGVCKGELDAGESLVEFWLGGRASQARDNLKALVERACIVRSAAHKFHSGQTPSDLGLEK